MPYRRAIIPGSARAPAKAPHAASCNRGASLQGAPHQGCSSTAPPGAPWRRGSGRRAASESGVAEVNEPLCFENGCEGAKNDAMIRGSAENEATGQGQVTERKAEKKSKII